MSNSPRCTLTLTLSLSLLGAGRALTQDATPPASPSPKDAAIAEFRALALKPTKSFDEQKERNEALAGWLAKIGDLDLGEWSFARAIAGYFNRDQAASQQLLDYWRQNKKLPTKDFDTIAGRMFMMHAMQAIRSGDLEVAGETTTLALELYSEPMTVYAAIGRGLKDAAKTEGAQAMLQALEKRLEADERLSAEKKQQARERMAAGQAGARPAGPKTIEPFQAVDLDGKPIALADYRGKVVLVDFWATWCGPCLREMPNVVAAHEKYRDQGFDVVGISLDKENAADKIREVMQKFGMGWRQIYDGKYWQAELAVRNGIKSIPAAFLFDRSGKCREAGLRGPALAAAIEKLLAEPAPEKPEKPEKTDK